jgi:hypothetical protein
MFESGGHQDDITLALPQHGMAVVHSTDAKI